MDEAGGKPYPILPGPQNTDWEEMASACWAHELVAQEEDTGEFFDTIIVCVVTGSTQAGMIAGFAEIEDGGGRQRRVSGIDASATRDKTTDQVTASPTVLYAHLGGQLALNAYSSIFE